ncbi:MAG: cell division protein FtsZ [Rhodospirillaceae bacterium]|jgi:cell division protein FtsZ|nr:cell division protein FtsZ [Rhodospirillaceae bacterium]
MSINLTVPEENGPPQLKPKLTVIGVGGAGGNAVNNMISSKLEGVDFVVANTDAQALGQSKTDRHIQLGASITQGLGAGSRPEVGRAAAEEAIEEIIAELNGANMAFIAAGMGGGTGTGGAPVIARAAKEHGILTVGVVTKPFQFEGSHRMTQAEGGIEELEQFVDTLIIIPNQNLFRIANEKTTFAEAFAMADEVLYSGVRGVTDLMVMPGLINLDFADVRSVMSEMGKAMMGTGEAEGERRALDAAEAAIANPLLDDSSMKGAKGVLINITGGMDITLFEVDEAANRIRAEVDQDAYIIVGSAFDESLDGIMRVSVVATGIDADTMQMPLPTMLHLAERLDYTEPRPEPARVEAEADPEPEVEAEEAPVFEAETEAEAEAEADADADADAYAAAELPVEMAADGAGESIGEESEAVNEEAEPETPPAAMPSVNADDVFIPPEPASATEDEIGDGGEAVAEAAPDTASETPGEAPEEAPAPSRVSLFERVTGSSRKVFGKKGPRPVEAPEVGENKEISATEEAPEQDPAPIVASIGETSETGGNELGGLDPEERLPASETVDDLLDIPAFLRRQAN